MRTAGVFFAVLLIAACPPHRVRVAYSAPPPQPPAVPVMPQPAPPGPVVAARTIDPEVEKHLKAWEEKTAGVNSLRTDVSLVRRDAVFKKETKHSGVVLLLRPNYFVLRLDNDDDKTKADYEWYLCDGKTVYVSSGAEKMIREFPLPLKWPVGGLLSAAKNPLLNLVIDTKAKDIAERFDVTVFKTDTNYVYLDLQPRSDTDKREVDRVRMALYGPKTEFAYLPAQVAVVRPNGDTELWKFSDPKANTLDIKPSNFAFAPVKGFGGLKPPPLKP